MVSKAWQTLNAPENDFSVYRDHLIPQTILIGGEAEFILL